jgi:mono/diheme cytochrome c family protein
MPSPARLALGLTIGLLTTQSMTRAIDDPPARQIDFERDVQPIFKRHCISCHGPEKQKNGLRLDRRADALAGGESGKAIVPGKAAESHLLRLVTAADVDVRMPPGKQPLTATQIATLRSWVEQGAKWPEDGSTTSQPADWWSFKPLARSPIPAGNTGANPVDYFIRAKLKEMHLLPVVEADRRTLIRRLYFDLIGLPPAPEEVDAFVKSTARDAYEKLVDRLLASPRYGERWARHWLDLVHFGETHGYDKDQPRPNAWPYRDYVIRSLNSDKPYARFIVEQIAGDVLYPGTIDGIVALGFLAAGPWDFIGHVEVPESKIDGKVARHLDRDDFVSNTMGTFIGLTVHCAQCHNHKFDPIAQADYYRLQAVFAAIDRTDKAYDLDPKTTAQRMELERKNKTAMARLAKLEADARRSAGPALAKIESQLSESAASSPKPAEYGYHSTLTDSQDSARWVQVDLGEALELRSILLKPCDDEFNNIGAGFGFPVRFKIEISSDPTFRAGVVVVANETAVDFPNPGTSPYVATLTGKIARYVRVTATKLAPRQNDYNFALAELEAIDASGKNRALGKPVSALDTIEAPVRWRKSNLTDGRFPPPPRLSALDRTKLVVQRDGMLQTAMGETGLKEIAALRAEITSTDADLAKLAASRRLAYVGAVHTGGGAFAGTGPFGGKPRPIRILSRGDVTKPGSEVSPGAIAAIPGLSGEFTLPVVHNEGDRRAALAKWITDPKNPLTWRVMANRIWQFHFGRALVDTPNDFGKMGQRPTHPELLDYLAAELRDHQSLKSLHRLIVTSATYKQSSATQAGNAKLDADNRYLWRQNRRKLEAEAVRDSILAVAGKLDLTMGGPSFRDFVVEKPEHSPHYEYHLHDPEDPKSHRRTIYRFVVRSKQQPFLAALDCADPSLAVEKRNETLTPQQALALLNNALALTMAKHFAERVQGLGESDAARVEAAFRLALGRAASRAEHEALTAYAKEFGLTNACRVILNLNEFMFVD